VKLSLSIPVTFLTVLIVVWKSTKQCLPLRDDDITTQTTNGWRRINTLAHYHIPDDATFIVATRQTPSDVTTSDGDSVHVTRTFNGNFSGTL
jgi:Plexin cytoplasmic RasGAP domain